MRLINTRYVKEGAVLAQPILDSTGRVLLHSGVHLTDLYIQRLRNLGYGMLYIEDNQLDDVEVRLAIEPKTKEIAYKTVVSVRHCIENNRLLKIDQMRAIMRQMISDLLNSHGLVGYLSDVKGYDDYTFHHSINTTIVALVIGMAFGYNEAQLQELGLGVLMHDVGKIKIAPDLLNKKDALTTEEFEEIKRHTTYGYEILRRNDDFGLLSAHVALQHQERWDGSGYPRRLKKQDIHEYARIAAVADVFEALTSNRPYRDALEPYQAYEYILAYSGIYFDPRVLEAFAKGVAIYPNGSGVILSNGLRGNVIKQNPGYPHRPYVRMFYLGDQPLSSPRDYNLIEHNSLLIIGTDNR